MQQGDVMPAEFEALASADAEQPASADTVSPLLAATPGVMQLQQRRQMMRQGMHFLSKRIFMPAHVHQQMHARKPILTPPTRRAEGLCKNNSIKSRCFCTAPGSVAGLPSSRLFKPTRG